MNTPDNKHVCDLELGGTSSVPCSQSLEQSLRYSIHQVQKQTKKLYDHLLSHNQFNNTRH